MPSSTGVRNLAIITNFSKALPFKAICKKPAQPIPLTAFFEYPMLCIILQTKAKQNPRKNEDLRRL
jgi:hypothetical protein